MATFASDFDKHSVPMPTWSTPTPTVPSAPGAGAQAQAFKSYGTTSGQAPISDTSAGLQSLQGTMQKNAGLSSSIDPNLSQDALAGNLAMAMRNQTGYYQPRTSFDGPMVTPTPTQPSYTPISGLGDYTARLTSKIDAYKPEAWISGGPGGKGDQWNLTEAGLMAPTREMFGGNNEDFMKASDLYDRLRLEEQDRAANSREQSYVNERNAEVLNRQRMQEAVAAADSAQQDIARQSKAARESLALRLAARGISETTDSWAGQQFEELDRMNLQAQEAVRQKTMLELKENSTRADMEMRDALVARIAAIQDAQNKLAEIDAGKEKNAADLLLLEKKKEDYDSKMADREYDNMLREREVAIKEGKSPAEIALIEARGGYVGAQTDYLTGAKTDLTNSQIAKTDAQTNRITTLLPAEKARIEAQVKKLLTPPRSGSGGAATGAALTKQFLSLTDNLNADLATGKRDWGQTFDLVKGSYPGVPDDLINQALGGSYDPGTGAAEGWAAPGAYETSKAKTTAGGDDFSALFLQP